MPFIVPKFIEKEAKIVGPLTFRQFGFFLFAGVIAFFLYFTIGKKNLPLFLIIIGPVIAIAMIFAFGKVEGRDFPVFLKNFLSHQQSPKMFYFQKKTIAPEILHFKIKKGEEEKKEMEPAKGFTKTSLQKMFVEIETKK